MRRRDGDAVDIEKPVEPVAMPDEIRAVIGAVLIEAEQKGAAVNRARGSGGA